MRAVDFAEQIQHLFRETIGTRADHQSLDFGIREDRFIFFTQLGDRRVGVRVVLKIGQIACARPFVREQANLVFNIRGKLAGAVVGTEGTAADTLRAVAIRAGETAVDGQLDRFFAKVSLQPGADRMVAQPLKAGRRCPVGHILPRRRMTCVRRVFFI